MKFLISQFSCLPKDKKYGAEFYAILSVPCFEFWILLHFDTILPNFYKDKHPCKNLIKNYLKKYIKNYEKGYNDFSQIITDENLDKATKFAIQICEQLGIEEPDNKEALRKFYNDESSFTNTFLVVEKFKEIS